MNCSGKMKHESDTYSRPTRRKSERNFGLVPVDGKSADSYDHGAGKEDREDDRHLSGTGLNKERS